MQGASRRESGSSMQCSSKEEDFWKIILGQLLIIPHSWQWIVFKLVSPHMNLDAGLVSISNDELNSMAKNHFARHCTVKTKTMISTPVILQYYYERRAEAEEGCYHGHCGRPWLGRMPRTGCVQDAHISSKALPSTAML